LLERIDAESVEPAPDLVEQGVSHAATTTTERRSLVLSRIGQGCFRDGLMSFWGGKCAVTGLDLPMLLRASHIKPWRDSDNRERLDPYNGLLLSPAYDAVFDSGLITFADDGGIVVSAQLTPLRLQQLGLDVMARTSRIHDEHRVYLAFHRLNVFMGVHGVIPEPKS
jgi:predicted restriction endonuclease